MAEADRQAIKALITDTLAVRLAHDVEKHQLPDAAVMEKFRGYVADSAEIVLANYERQLAVNSLCDAVIERLRDDLVRRSRVSALIEVAINAGAVILGLIGGAIVVFLDPAANAMEIKVLALAIFAIVLVQFFGNLYLKHFDHKR
ncbi:MAG: hypothetical protein M0R03_10750 [Novosphingobium sp.]|nr:hypothetical protein [Novosphingobium sp.]